MSRWTEQEEKEAIKLLKNKFNYRQIANELDRTSNSVRNKIVKLGYKISTEIKETRKCLSCKKEFETTFSDVKKFCNRSCAATITNKTRKIKKIKNTCLICNKEIRKTSKFCSNQCCSKHNKNQNFEKIKNGDVTLYEKWYKLFLIENYGNKCMKCGWNKTHPTTGKIPIQLEHVDGNSENNSLNNLKILCPNCHSLTLTYGSLNNGNGREKRKLKRQGKTQ